MELKDIEQMQTNENFEGNFLSIIKKEIACDNVNFAFEEDLKSITLFTDNKIFSESLKFETTEFLDEIKFHIAENLLTYFNSIGRYYILIDFDKKIRYILPYYKVIGRELRQKHPNLEKELNNKTILKNLHKVPAEIFLSLYNKIKLEFPEEDKKIFEEFDFDSPDSFIRNLQKKLKDTKWIPSLYQSFNNLSAIIEIGVLIYHQNDENVGKIFSKKIDVAAFSKNKINKITPEISEKCFAYTDILKGEIYFFDMTKRILYNLERSNTTAEEISKINPIHKILDITDWKNIYIKIKNFV